jgi:hypothetical protein
MTPAEIAAQVAETRARQGLPPTITDPTTLAGLAATVAGTMTRERGDGDRRGPPGGAETGRPPAKTDARQDTPVRASTGTVSPATQTGQEGTPFVGVVVAMPGDDEGRGSPHLPGPGPFTATDGTTILADRQRRARARIRAQNEHRRVCRQLEGLASLAAYYGARRPQPVPLAQFLAEGWWAA